MFSCDIARIVLKKLNICSTSSISQRTSGSTKEHINLYQSQTVDICARPTDPTKHLGQPMGRTPGDLGIWDQSDPDPDPTWLENSGVKGRGDGEAWGTWFCRQMVTLVCQMLWFWSISMAKPDCYQRLKITKLSQRSTQDSFGRKIQLVLGNSAEALKNEWFELLAASKLHESLRT